MNDEMYAQFQEEYQEKKLTKRKRAWEKLGPSIVCYDNDLNATNVGILSPLEQNAFFYACAKVRDLEGTDIKVSFDEYKRATKFPLRKSDKDLIASFEKVANALKYFEFRKPLEKYGFEMGSIFTWFQADAVERTFTIKVNDRFLYLFNNLEENGFYTQFSYNCFTMIKDKHSKTLFRLISQWKTIGKTPWFSLDYIKFLTGTQKYENRNLRSKVIEPAIEECSEYVEKLKVVYSEDKTKVMFTFRKFLNVPFLEEKKNDV